MRDSNIVASEKYTSDSEASSVGKVTVRPTLILLTATLLCLLPFVNKAFHIDDPLFVWCAKFIRLHPSDPYGFWVNWYGHETGMFLITKNPPLVCYFMALVSYLVGWNEVGLHAFFIIPAFAVVLGTYRLAQRMCDNPLFAALITLLTPVFLVSSTTVMCDVPMLALWIWAIVFWMRGLDENRHSSLAIAAVFLAASALTKYYGMTLIPLLLLYSLVKKRRIGMWLLYSLIPIALLGAYQWITHGIYGRGLLSDAASYAGWAGARHGGASPVKLLVGLAFTGGCLAPLLFFAPRLWSWRTLLAGVVLAIITAIALTHLQAIDRFYMQTDSGPRWDVIVQLAILAPVGLSMLVICVLDFIRHRDAESVLLCGWAIATFIFASVVNWSVNGRSILPAVPPMGILLMRRIQARSKSEISYRPLYLILPLVLSAAISLWVASADYMLANASRTAAERIRSDYRPYARTLWFEGHWGFQYYMMLYKGKPVDRSSSVAEMGDVIAVPGNNTNFVGFQESNVALLSEIIIPGGIGVTTNNKDLGAGFYSHVVGPLPFAFGHVPSERYYIVIPRKRFAIHP